jgi:hypothetical protein
MTSTNRSHEKMESMKDHMFLSFVISHLNRNKIFLTFNEVTTLFHEFGHALHGMLANTTYPSLSGTSVYWDFVELPSQVMENWCYEPKHWHCLQNIMKRGSYPSRICTKNQRKEFLRRNGNIKTDQFWTIRHDLSRKIASD